MKRSDGILNMVESYYSTKIRDHGTTPAGVDWNGTESQNLRFQQLMRIADGTRDFTLAEIGCGYGALVDYLTDQKVARYLGIDVSEAMIAEARKCHAAVPWAQFETASKVEEPHDFCVASGIFNVRMEVADGEWLDYILATLDQIDAASRRGFAFNALTSYSDADKKRDYLYYCDPAMIFDHCKRHYSRNVALLHDYDLYEFTILVRKAAA